MTFIKKPGEVDTAARLPSMPSRVLSKGGWDGGGGHQSVCMGAGLIFPRRHMQAMANQTFACAG